MGSTQQFCLKWNNHQSNMLSIFDQLLSSEHFVDVTLACDGLSVRAHKMVLSACSPFFQSLFIQNPCDHPIVILKDIRFVDLKALVQFMYRGEVNVSQDQLPTLLKAAEALKIKGLAEVTNESGQKPSVGSLGVSHNGHHSAGGLKGGEQPSVQAAPSPMANPLPASTPLVNQNALVAAMQQTALKAQLAAVAAAQASHQANSAAGQNSHDRHTASSAAASHESNSNASTPLRQTDSPMSQQNLRKRRRKSGGSDKGSGDENSGGESGVEDQMDDTRASDDDSGGEEAEFEPSKLLEQSMTEVRQGHQDNNSSSSDNQTKDSNQADIKPVLNFDSANPAAGLAINPQDPTAVLAFAAAAQAAGASANSADSVAGPSQPTHGLVSSTLALASSTMKDDPRPGPIVAHEGASPVLSTNGIITDRASGMHCCEFCGYMSSNRGNVTYHIRSKHTGERPYGCPYCDYRSSRKTTLRLHMNRHRPFGTDPQPPVSSSTISSLNAANHMELVLGVGLDLLSGQSR